MNVTRGTEIRIRVSHFIRSLSRIDNSQYASEIDDYQSNNDLSEPPLIFKLYHCVNNALHLTKASLVCRNMIKVMKLYSSPQGNEFCTIQ